MYFHNNWQLLAQLFLNLQESRRNVGITPLRVTASLYPPHSPHVPWRALSNAQLFTASLWWLLLFRLSSKHYNHQYGPWVPSWWPLPTPLPSSPALKYHHTPSRSQTTHSHAFFISTTLSICFPFLLYWVGYDPFFNTGVKFNILFKASLILLGSITCPLLYIPRIHQVSLWHEV